MSPKRPRPRRTSVEREEENAWVDFYRRIRRDPELATEVLAQLNRDAELLRAHLALFLCCKEALRRDKMRQTRNRRIGAFVRWLARTLFTVPWHALRRTGQESRDIMVEMLPQIEQRSGSGSHTRKPAVTHPGMPAVIRRKRNPSPMTHMDAEEDGSPSSRT
ncbi:MAG: hypothetical protein LBI92_03985 [Azoarcus sp.]|jgi:hypothetical protein|nr:hypothetical protein [Azoarcus sp.]